MVCQFLNNLVLFLFGDLYYWMRKPWGKMFLKLFMSTIIASLWKYSSKFIVYNKALNGSFWNGQKEKPIIEMITKKNALKIRLLKKVTIRPIHKFSRLSLNWIYFLITTKGKTEDSLVAWECFLGTMKHEINKSLYFYYFYLKRVFWSTTVLQFQNVFFFNV